MSLSIDGINNGQTTFTAHNNLKDGNWQDRVFSKISKVSHWIKENSDMIVLALTIAAIAAVIITCAILFPEITSCVLILGGLFYLAAATDQAHDYSMKEYRNSLEQAKLLNCD